MSKLEDVPKTDSNSIIKHITEFATEIEQLFQNSPEVKTLIKLEEPQFSNQLSTQLEQILLALKFSKSS